MNEDIERILNTLKKYYDGLGWPYYPEDILEPKDTKIIYDYIILLQNNWKELKKWLEENESFDDYCNETTFTSVLDKMQKLEQGK